MAKSNGTNKSPAIGIDLGTTFSCVSFVRNGKVVIIPNERGKRTTPSFVAFNEFERLIGDAAKHQIAANAENTIFDAKRLMGRKFNDPIVQEDMKQWPFKVVEENEMLKIEVTYKGEVKRFLVEEISAMVLGKLKELAEDYLNVNVENAVITVPAHFNDLQRRATIDAANIARLNVLRIINEPTAAAIAYGLDNATDIAHNILVYDLGGGTFDVSILNVHNRIFEVKATAGDPHLGGEDFNNRMMEAFAKVIKRRHDIDISQSKKALRKLRNACEKAKQTLSSAMQATVDIDSLCGGIDFVASINRARFESLCADLFKSTISIVSGALNDAGMQSADIDKVVLVGGSTRIPKIRELLQEMFPEKEICKTINADEAIALGAAVQASVIQGDASEEMSNVVLLDVTPLTLGTDIMREKDEVMIMSPVINRNTRIPACKSETYYTSFDNQTRMRFTVLQGEHQLAKDNFEIGKFMIDGIPPAIARREKAIATFTIDENGVLTVSAVSKSNAGVKGQITIKNVCGSLTSDEIDRALDVAQVYRQEDREMAQLKTARTDLEQYCDELKDKYGSEHDFVAAKCNEVFSWLETCVRPTLAQFEQLKTELQSLNSQIEDEKHK